jgi:hypothetical protein
MPNLLFFGSIFLAVFSLLPIGVGIRSIVTGELRLPLGRARLKRVEKAAEYWKATVLCSHGPPY